jgi:hypothetical protein
LFSPPLDKAFLSFSNQGAKEAFCILSRPDYVSCKGCAARICNLRLFSVSGVKDYRPARRARVLAAFLAEADRAAAERPADAAPPLRPPFVAGAFLVGLPLPDPLFLPPPDILLTVAQARRSASLSPTPRSLYPFSMCSAWRSCFPVYFVFSPLGMNPHSFLVFLQGDNVREMKTRWIAKEMPRAVIRHDAQPGKLSHWVLSYMEETLSFLLSMTNS